MADQAMLDRIAVHEADMTFHIDGIANAIIPEARMPELIGVFFEHVSARNHALREAGLQILDPPTEVIVIRWKHPYRVHMIGQDDGGDGFERVQMFKIARTVGELSDMAGQQRTVGIGKGYGQKPGPFRPKEIGQIAHRAIKQTLCDPCKLQNCNGFFLSHTNSA